MQKLSYLGILRKPRQLWEPQLNLTVVFTYTPFLSFNSVFDDFHSFFIV